MLLMISRKAVPLFSILHQTQLADSSRSFGALVAEVMIANSKKGLLTTLVTRYLTSRPSPRHEKRQCPVTTSSERRAVTSGIPPDARSVDLSRFCCAPVKPSYSDIVYFWIH